jgi:hypothetical protein
MANWHYVRVRPGSEGLVRDSVTGFPSALDPRRPYRSDDQVVLDNPDMFVTDDELAREQHALDDGDAGRIERATRAPGERRTVRRG